MPKLTLKRIAMHFGVSVSTVSKAINGSSEISESVASKIRDFAKEHRYRPNKTAVNLRRRKTGAIAVVVPNILNFFFVQVLYGIEKVASEQGFSLISCISDDSNEKETDIIQMLDSGTVDGIIMSLAHETQKLDLLDHVTSLADNGLPLVLFDRVNDSVRCDKVVVDDEEAGYRATKHLLDTDCKRIAWASPIGNASVAKLRFLGYKKALQEAGISYDHKLTLDYKDDDDLRLSLTLLLGEAPIDGIIGLDELTGVNILALLKNKGYAVPDAISVIGFTNGPLSNYVSPSLTTVSQHGKYIGEAAAKMLLARMDDTRPGQNFRTQTIKTSLLLRESTRVPK